MHSLLPSLSLRNGNAQLLSHGKPHHFGRQLGTNADIFLAGGRARAVRRKV